MEFFRAFVREFRPKYTLKIPKMNQTNKGCSLKFIECGVAWRPGKFKEFIASLEFQLSLQYLGPSDNRWSSLKSGQVGWSGWLAGNSCNNLPSFIQQGFFWTSFSPKQQQLGNWFDHWFDHTTPIDDSGRLHHLGSSSRVGRHGSLWDESVKRCNLSTNNTFSVSTLTSCKTPISRSSPWVTL